MILKPEHYLAGLMAYEDDHVITILDGKGFIERFHAPTCEISYIHHYADKYVKDKNGNNMVFNRMAGMPELSERITGGN